MLDWMVNQVRLEEMQREAEKHRQVRDLLQAQRPSHNKTGIFALISRKFASVRPALALRANVLQTSQIRSRKT
jgi:hypothetical protein